MPDKFDFLAKSLTSPATDFFAIVPSDSVEFKQLPRSIYVGVGGTIAAMSEDGSLVSFAGVQAGSTLPIRPRRIMATGTSATNIIGLA